MKSLDVVSIGRGFIDLYGMQVAGLLEGMASFQTYVGGSPASTEIGVSRLGLRTGFVSRVGDEYMGRFIRQQMAREGVNPQAPGPFQICGGG